MARIALLVLLLIADLRAQALIEVAGVGLRVGMTQESVLAKFNERVDVRLSVIAPGRYWITVKRLDGWTAAGALSFEEGRLSGVTLEEQSDNEAKTAELVKGFYNAIADAETSGLIRVYTARNNDAKQPSFEVHLLFKDREVVVSTHKVQGTPITSVKTNFPK